MEGIEIAETGDRFGAVVAVAELQHENDGDELIVGVPFEDIDGHVDAGVVHIIGQQSGSRWAFPNAQTIRASDVGMGQQSGANFGAAVAAAGHRQSHIPRAQFDSRDTPPEVSDLIVGSPYYAASSERGGAVVSVVGGIDVTAPEVFVSVTPRQGNPIVNRPSICFDILFSEPVTNFTASDLVPGGMSDLVSEVIVANKDNTFFTVAVAGMSMSGQVTAYVPSGSAVDEYGVPNVESNEAVADYIFILTAELRRREELDGEIRLEIEFNRPVVELTAEDVRLGGSAQPQRLTVLPHGELPGVFVVEIYGMKRDGTVTLDFRKDLWPGEFENYGIRVPFLKPPSPRSHWTNPSNAYDINGDGHVTAGDVLVIINEINNRGTSRASGLLFDESEPLMFFDSNGDGYVTASDVIMVINQLNTT